MSTPFCRRDMAIISSTRRPSVAKTVNQLSGYSTSDKLTGYDVITYGDR